MSYYDYLYGGLLAGDETNGSGGSELVGGYRMIIAGGTASQMRYFPVETVSGASVTLQAGGFYKINATTQQITLNAETIPNGSAGLEGHAEIFVAGTGSVKEGANVTLVNALEPDAVNNCTLRFYNGLCRVSVEDHAAGYIVKSPTGTTSGTLYYGLGTASEAYIAVDASLNGTTLDLGGVVTSAGEKHLVGNGYTETVVSGAINCTSKTTFANLGMSNVIISSGTLTLGDAFIPSGSTVAVSGGGLAVEKVVGEGAESVIDLGGTHIQVGSGMSASASGCTFSGGVGDRGGGLLVRGGMVLSGCSITGCSASYGGGIYAESGYTNVVSSVVSGNIGATGAGGDICATDNSDAVLISASTVGDCAMTSAGHYTLAGNCDIVRMYAIGNNGGLVTISSGATIELTDKIAPNGGIVVDGGCAVNGVAVAGGTYTSIVSSGGSAVVNE